MADTIPFPDWSPDLTDLGAVTSILISGVLPRADGYGPSKAFSAFTSALAAACRGYFFARRADGSIAVFAGTSTNLYRLNNTTFAWTLVSSGGGPYSTLVDGDNWQFRQFNDFVIAVQVGIVPQKYVLSTDTGFSVLLGSPPQAAAIAIINRFVVLCGLSSNPRRVHWSDLDAPETWTAGTGLADYQDLPDGGTVRGIAGGDAYGAVFQDDPIRSLVYQPGSAVTFQITKISESDPLYAKYSIIQAGSRIGFLSAQGFKVIEGPGSAPKSIGKEIVDRYFFGDVDSGALQLVIGAPDPAGTRMFWAYKSQAGQAGLFDKMLCFDYGISQRGKWSLVPASGEYLAALAKPGLTLEQLDAIAPTQLTVTGAANNGAGLVRLTLSALSNASFDIHGQNFIVVQGVLGTTEANGSWAFTIIDATHIDLVGSTFANAYVSGGAIGGNLDLLPFSLDSVSTSALAALSAVSSAHRVGFFNGANIEAILQTPEIDLKGTVGFVSEVRPMTDAPDALVSLGGRMRQIDAVAYTDESAIGDNGTCGILLESRYIKAKMRIPAGSVWTYAAGIQPEDAQQAGES